MQAKRFAARVAADLQRLPGRHRDRRTPAVIELIGVRDQRAEAVVAAGQIEHDQVAAGRALRLREVREKRWRGQTDRERGDSVFDELASADHTN